MADTIIHCIDCGAEVHAYRSTTQRCPKCQALREKMQRREGKKRARLRKKAEKTSESAPRTVCPYCGKPTPNEVYCDLCLEQGFDNLHKEFGMTNGWDKPKKQKIPLVPGNRGFIPSGAVNISKTAPYFSHLSNSIRR